MFPADLSQWPPQRVTILVKTHQDHQLGHVNADKSIVWKLSTPLCIDLASSMISAAIRAIDFPSVTIQVLHPAEELSQYWENSPNKGYLHVIVQVSSVERPEKRRRLELSDETIERVRETAKHLHSTLWKKPLDRIFATVDVPDSERRQFASRKSRL
ncbi:hypothetical protein B0F90DRAFT_1821054 [Multifurca ochricompacta]|uniref:Uncharacterized protein n=1 Tax=Multifurca ochricompacta TaxID=376703 RepID=A0AAD4LZN6_9AGAM|nr:hypothetical protein B0F90DRAFT_1821054 [Multifurca ochricompacta]